MSTRYVHKRFRNVRMSELIHICTSSICDKCVLKDICENFSLEFKEKYFNRKITIKYKY